MMTSVNGSQSLSPIHRPTETPGGSGGGSGSVVGGPGGAAVEQSPVDRTKGFFPDESEPLLRCDSTSSKDSALSRNGSFITKGKESMKLMCTAANKHRWQITDMCSTSCPPKAPLLTFFHFTFFFLLFFLLWLLHPTQKSNSTSITYCISMQIHMIVFGYSPSRRSMSRFLGQTWAFVSHTLPTHCSLGCSQQMQASAL